MEEEDKELERDISQQADIDDLIAGVLEEKSSDIQELIDQHEKLSKKFSALNDCVLSLKKTLEDHNSLKQLVDDLGNQCRDLREQQHERELILPLVRSIIAIADRCRGQMKELDEMIFKNNKAKNKSGVKALQYIVKSRQADLTELEEALANLGVETYENPEKNYKPELQKPLQRIKSKKSELHLQIAARILPGYRRFERVVRKEIVNVYVNHSN